MGNNIKRRNTEIEEIGVLIHVVTIYHHEISFYSENQENKLVARSKATYEIMVNSLDTTKVI